MHLSIGFWKGGRKGIKQNRSLKAMVEPLSIAGGIANITAALPVVQDAFVYAGNWMVSNTIGALMLAMGLVAFGIAVIMKIVRGKRGRR